MLYFNLNMGLDFSLPLTTMLYFMPYTHNLKDVKMFALKAIGKKPR